MAQRWETWKHLRGSIAGIKMGRVSSINTNFTAGELSPTLDGRVDIVKYFNGCKTLQNMLVMVHGPATRRGGFNFVVEVKDSSKKTRLLPFAFSVAQSYILEFGHNYIRFHRNYSSISTTPFSPEFSADFDKGVFYEVATTYSEDEVGELNITQSADVLFIAHKNHAPKELNRMSQNVWEINDIKFKDGPYLPINTTDTTLALSGTSGNVNVTASDVEGINDDTGFQSTDIGRLIRFEDSANNWTWLEIKTVTSTLIVVATIKGEAPNNGTAVTGWRLGSFSETSGYPSIVTFFEERLVWAASTTRPQTMFFSRSADYVNYAPTEPDGTVVDDNALVYTIATDQVNLIRWMRSGEVLSVGTAGGEFIVSSGSNKEPLSPTNARIVRQTTFGSSSVKPVQSGNSVLFVQRAGRKVREYIYQYESDSYNAPDLSLLADHITVGGITDMAYQQEPDSIVWMVRKDGVLLGLTYERSQEVTAWHRHTVGGTNAKVESIAVISAPDGNRDDLWAIISRTINGQTKKYIEYLGEGLADEDTTAVNAKFLDSMMTYDGLPTTTISGLHHLEGEKVDILADGSVHPCATVVNGGITINKAASVIHVGLPYQSILQTMRIEGGAEDGTSQAFKKRIAKIHIRFFKTVGAKFGTDINSLQTLTFRQSGDRMGEAVPLFTGDKNQQFSNKVETDGFIVIEQEQPLPLTVLAIMSELRTTKV